MESGNGYAVLAILLAIVLYAIRTSLGGRPLIAAEIVTKVPLFALPGMEI